MTLLELRNLSKSFSRPSSLFARSRMPVPAVMDVSLNVKAGETLALVGESGAGKSTVGRLALRLMEPDAGTITFDGRNVLAMGRSELRGLRRQMQIIFQDPYSSLDPRMSVGESVEEPLLVHFRVTAAERRSTVEGLLDRVGLTSRDLSRLPRELSGGQLQRASIARALTLRPALIVCDEPLSALDVSVQAQVVQLMQELQEELGLAYLFISHDLALVQVIADHVVVMRAGSVVEEGDPKTVYESPKTEYVKSLLDAIPVPDPRAGRRR